jgi:adenylate cyclase class IV
MGRNIEIKARVDNIQELIPRAKKIADSGPTVLVQDDTFFHCPSGRSKLRTYDPDNGELIFYQRSDETGPKVSTYSIVHTAMPGPLREVLACAYGLVGRVRKTRTLFLSGRTRIHLDEVEDLGAFIELEVVLWPDEPAEAGVQVARKLMSQLEIPHQRLVAGAYLDMLQSRRLNHTNEH